MDQRSPPFAKCIQNARRTKFQAEGKLLDLIRDARKALLSAEHGENVEDRRRGGPPGQRGAQRLRDASELHASLFGIGPRRGFERARLPRIELCETLMKRRKALSGITLQKLRGLLVEVERARHEEIARR